jgi:hypothetical protein
MIDLEEVYRLRKEEAVAEQKDEAMRKVEEAIHATTQSTFKMMDRHNEMVKKSQEISKAQAKKRALERLAEKRIEEHREVLAEMAIRNAERRDLLEEARLKEQQA